MFENFFRNYVEIFFCMLKRREGKEVKLTRFNSRQMQELALQELL
jgi:hypothetical protein